MCPGGWVRSRFLLLASMAGTSPLPQQQRAVPEGPMVCVAVAGTAAQRCAEHTGCFSGGRAFLPISYYLALSAVQQLLLK